MQRPMLARRWVTAAQQHSTERADHRLETGRLDAGAADALRLMCTLLDSPLPPELAQHYGADARASAA